MIKLLQRFFSWIFSMEPKSWPSYNGWIDEPLAGIILTAIVAADTTAILSFFHTHNVRLDVVLTFLAASLLSFVYEKWVDIHHWDLNDFMQRYVGILLVLVVWLMIEVKP